MKCHRVDCTGNHNDRKYATLCPRTIAEKNTNRARNYRERYNNDPAFREYQKERRRRYDATAAGMITRSRANAHRREQT